MVYKDTYLILFFLIWFFFLGYLILETRTVRRRCEFVPQRITVTGTRGKSTVVRLLCSVLREDGLRVIAKTTGSEPRIILPDGSEETVFRRGRPSVLEQKTLMAAAARMDAECVVAEVMSLHGENHRAERRILMPQTVVITNVREDHWESMGRSRLDISRVLLEDVPDHASVFLPASERELFRDLPSRLQNSEWNHVKAGTSGLKNMHPENKSTILFQDQIDLVFATAKRMGVAPEVIARGIRKTRLDAGAARIWRIALKEKEKHLLCVNGFAANDPESTDILLEKVMSLLPEPSREVIGLLNLRRDRTDRTLQWMRAMKADALHGFDRWIVVGAGSGALRRRLPNIASFGTGDPVKIMDKISAQAQGSELVFGCGNMGGAGMRFVDYWDRMGKPYAV